MTGQDPWHARPSEPSVYRTEYTVSDPSGRTIAASLSGLHERILGDGGRRMLADLFSHPDARVQARLSELMEEARSQDAVHALGAVLLACAYRRLAAQGGLP